MKSGRNEDRMRDFLTRYANGETIKEIAMYWSCSQKTVEYYWAQAKLLFGLRCPQDVVKFALRHNWISL